MVATKILIIFRGPFNKNLLSEIEISSYDIAISALDDDQTIAAVLLASDMGERTGLILYDADLVDVVEGNYFFRRQEACCY